MKLFKRFIYTRNYIDNFPATEKNIYNLCKSGSLQYVSQRALRKYSNLKDLGVYQYIKSQKRSDIVDYRLLRLMHFLDVAINIQNDYINSIEQITNTQNMYDVMTRFDRNVLNQLDSLTVEYEKINKLIQEINLMNNHGELFFIEYTNELMEEYRFIFFIECLRDFIGFKVLI